MPDCTVTGIGRELDVTGEWDTTPPAIADPTHVGAPPEAAQARLGRGMINDSALSPDMQYMAVGGNTGLYLYRTDTLEEVWAQFVSQPVAEVAFSPDGVTLAAQLLNSEAQSFAVDRWLDPHVTLWDVETGDIVYTFAGAAPHLTWPSDGTLIALGSAYDEVTVWDTRTGEVVHTLEGATHSVAWSPDGAALATGATAGSVIVWDSKTGELLQTLPAPEVDGYTVYEGHTDRLWWSPDGRLVAAEVEMFYEPLVRVSDGPYSITLLTVWDARTGERLHPLMEERMVGWSPDGTMFASRSVNALNVWDTESGEKLCSLRGPSNRPLHAEWSPGGQLVAMKHDASVRMKDVVWRPDSTMLALILWGDADAGVMIWDGQAGKAPRVLGGYSGWYWVRDMTWSPEGEELAVGMDDGRVTIWDVVTNDQLRVLTELGGMVAWSPDGTMLATGLSELLRVESDASITQRGATIVWDAETGEQLHELEDGLVSSIAWSPDSQMLALGAEDGQVILWDTSITEQPRRLVGHANPANDIVWSPDGALLASASSGGTVILWDAQTGEQVRTLVTQALVLAWSPDGSTLATGGAGYNGEVALWSIETGEQLRTFSGPSYSANVTDVAWSPDGRVLASTFYYDSLVHLWDAETGEELDVLEGHTESVTSLAWSPDGRLLASGSTDTTVILWEVDP